MSDSPRVIIITERQGDKVTRLGHNPEGYFIECWTLGEGTVASRIPLTERILKEILGSADLKKMLGA